MAAVTYFTYQRVFKRPIHLSILSCSPLRFPWASSSKKTMCTQFRCRSCNGASPFWRPSHTSLCTPCRRRRSTATAGTPPRPENVPVSSCPVVGNLPLLLSHRRLDRSEKNAFLEFWWTFNQLTRKWCQRIIYGAKNGSPLWRFDNVIGLRRLSNRRPHLP